MEAPIAVMEAIFMVLRSSSERKKKNEEMKKEGKEIIKDKGENGRRFCWRMNGMNVWSFKPPTRIIV